MTDATDSSQDDVRRRSAAWWRRTSAAPALLHAWLQKQLVGEQTAAARIRALAQRFAVDARARRTLELIAAQEERHARWVEGLLTARGMSPAHAHIDRYWAQTVPGVLDLRTGCAVGAHAERMRLFRIEAIAADDQAPADVRAVFARILVEERFHERAFRTLAGPEAMAQTAGAHARGMRALGLSP